MGTYPLGPPVPGRPGVAKLLTVEIAAFVTVPISWPSVTRLFVGACDGPTVKMMFCSVFC